MSAMLRHWPRILITLVPVVLMLVNLGSTVRRPVLDGLDLFIADARLRLTLPGRLDPRIVIVDIDDARLQAVTPRRPARRGLASGLGDATSWPP